MNNMNQSAGRKMSASDNKDSDLGVRIGSLSVSMNLRVDKAMFIVIGIVAPLLLVGAVAMLFSKALPEGSLITIGIGLMIIVSAVLMETVRAWKEIILKREDIALKAIEHLENERQRQAEDTKCEQSMEEATSTIDDKDETAPIVVVVENMEIEGE